MTDVGERKYQTLVRVLDKLADAAGDALPRKYLKGADGHEDPDKVRARSFIHLYLKVVHQILAPDDREASVTEGPGDGGLDAYFIDHRRKTVFLIQSKFRTTASGFEEKRLDLTELNKLQLDPILRGHDSDENGVKFNGRVQAFQRTIRELGSVATFRYRIVILANLDDNSQKLFKKVFAEYDVDFFDFERCYEDLLFPIIDADAYYAEDLTLSVNTSEGVISPRLSASVQTRFGRCQLSVVLIPTVEIAKCLRDYRNAILRFNPRSFLEFKMQRTNENIYESILGENYGEFALLNNGITIVADECHFSDRIAQEGSGAITLMNPQIINGGQTAFTLAHALGLDGKEADPAIYEGKEVLLRIIDLSKIASEDRVTLISEISVATNTQTHVSYADRRVNGEAHRTIAERLFSRTGLLYEYKTGEFAAAAQEGLIDDAAILERNFFHRLAYLAKKDYPRAISGRLMKKGRGLLEEPLTDDELDQIPRLLALFSAMDVSGKKAATHVTTVRECVIAEILRLKSDKPLSLHELVTLSRGEWPNFLRFARKMPQLKTKHGLSTKELKALTRKLTRDLELSQWLSEGEFLVDLEKFAESLLKSHQAPPEAGAAATTIPS